MSTLTSYLNWAIFEVVGMCRLQRISDAVFESWLQAAVIATGLQLHWFGKTKSNADHQWKQQNKEGNAGGTGQIDEHHFGVGLNAGEKKIRKWQTAFLKTYYMKTWHSEENQQLGKQEECCWNHKTSSRWVDQKVSKKEWKIAQMHLSFIHVRWSFKR